MQMGAGRCRWSVGVGALGSRVSGFLHYTLRKCALLSSLDMRLSIRVHVPRFRRELVYGSRSQYCCRTLGLICHGISEDGGEPGQQARRRAQNFYRCEAFGFGSAKCAHSGAASVAPRTHGCASPTSATIWTKMSSHIKRTMCVCPWVHECLSASDR